jgi:hypothetical protein
MAILACMARKAQECLSRVTRVDDELRKGMNVEPRHSLLRIRMLSMNPKNDKMRRVYSILLARESRMIRQAC